MRFPVNDKQRRAVRETAKKGCGSCGKPATTIVVWSFVDTTQKNLEHPILAFVRCADHLEDARAQRPQVDPHIRVEITEESLKPLVFN